MPDEHYPYLLATRYVHTNHPELIEIQKIKKYNPLLEREVEMYKYITRTPLGIPSLRRIIGEEYCYEDHIKYVQNVIFDFQLIPGLDYDLNLSLSAQDIPQKSIIKQSIENNLGKEEKKWLDLYLECLLAPIPDIKRVAVDIEVHSSDNRMPNVRSAEEPVISFAYYDGVRKGVISICDLCNKNDCPKTAQKRKECINNGETIELERMLIGTFLNIINSYPMVVTFNGDEFDLKYILYRAKKLRVRNADKILYLDKSGFMHIKYGVHLDLYQFCRQKPVQVYAFKKKYNNYGLDNIAIALIGKGKLETDFVTELDNEKLKEYNLMDAEITYELTSFDDNLMLKLIILVMRVCKCDFFYATRSSGITWLGNMLDWIHRQQNWLIPKREDLERKSKESNISKSIIDGKKYRGAVVLDNKEGVYFGAKTYDFASSYPSAIYQWNLSYETVNCSHRECRDNKVPDTTHWVCVKKRGMLATHIGLILLLRTKYFKPHKKDITGGIAIEQILKVIMNMSYGVFGNEACNYHYLPLSDCTTAIGRFNILSAKEFVERKFGKTPIHGDSDSITYYNPSEELERELFDFALKELKVEMGVDYDWRYVIFSRRKKMYIGVEHNGNVVIKGLQGKKKNTPPIFKSAFKFITEILREVYTPEDLENTKLIIIKTLRGVREKLRRRKVKPEEVVFDVTISKETWKYTKVIPQHIRAAKLYEQLEGVMLAPGDSVQYIKCRDGLVQPVKYADVTKLDVAVYIKQLESTMNPILEPLGIDFDSEINGRKRLDQYFS